MKKTVICTVCPRGCLIEASFTDKRDLSLSGYGCPRGERYAEDECFAPKRTFTGSVRIEGAGRRMLPVRSSGPVPRELLKRCAEETRRLSLAAPAAKHQVLIQNVLDTGVDLIASMTLEREG